MLHVKGLDIHAGEFTVNDVGFTINRGDYFFLLGESGSGKSLILEALAGIRVVKKGSILLKGSEISTLPVNKRNLGMVFQNLALFSHKTVFQNIAFPLRQQKVSGSVIRNAVVSIAERLAIAGLLERYPGSLSGGEHQRVALARTLVMKPDVLLLDEPLSSLDILLKEEMIGVLKSIHHSGQSILHVTHDYHVVSKLATKIAIIEKGKIIQQGTPEMIAGDPQCLLARRILMPERGW
ncbi:MAG: ATP-binding cassette domain-containing protein [Bacteroidales bacterium]|nr:ATP-binding cassette domain-containing protein [Bacteroidales bacterium]